MPDGHKQTEQSASDTGNAAIVYAGGGVIWFGGLVPWVAPASAYVWLGCWS